MSGEGERGAPGASASAPLGATIAAWIALIVFVLGLAGALYLSTQAANLRARARTANSTGDAARTLSGDLTAAQNAQRGYLLTGDEAFLQPYYLSRVAAEADFKALANLASGDARHAKRLSALKPLVQYKIGELEQTIDLARAGRRDAALAIVSSAANRNAIAALSAGLDEIGATAGVELAQTRAAIDRNSLWQQTVIIASIVLVLFLATIVARTRTRMLRDLASQNLLLEERVRERTAALEARSKRVETLIQDVSHRVGNSLSLVTSFLDLQARQSKSEEVKTALAAARQRVFSIAAAQRRMRLAMDSDTVDSQPFFEALIDDFRHALPDARISIETDIQNVALASQDASAFGVIINELLANAIKHAWAPNETGALSVTFAQQDGNNVLRVSDDGAGGGREDDTGGLGKVLVQSLVQSIKGALETKPAREDGARPGLAATVRAPV
jgi:two-component sensor histidine kinase/CHASE3 domain sensor protein